MSTPSHLLWVDLESTGLDTDRDEIAEIGAILTNTNLDAIDEFSSLVSMTDAGVRRITSTPAVYRIHLASGLLNDVMKDAGRADNITEAEASVLQWINRNIGSDADMFLAGSGVSHFDHEMIKKHMPRLSARLHYASIDVGVLRRFYKMVNGTDLVDDNDKKTHRAIDDVRCHLSEARAFQKLFRTHDVAGVV